MVAYPRCKDCKHYYNYFKQITTEEGLIDVITIPKCRLGHEIKQDDSIANLDCFESRKH